jgi:L-amino acid N-acyltransferase YncA
VEPRSPAPDAPAIPGAGLEVEPPRDLAARAPSSPADLRAFALRPAAREDVPAIARIYARHVADGTASFELDPPGETEMLRRFDALAAARHPYLVAADPAGRILGYAYAGPYRLRPGYRFTVEDSVYVDAGATGRGIGRALLEALVEACTGRGDRQMVAVIGGDDARASIALHLSAGFREAGRLHAVGRKHGRWLDSVLMQRALGEGDASPPAAEVP